MVKQMIKTKKSGFTLIELLVVISIIAVLMSIMMPALSKVRAQATKTVCMTRMRSIGTAMVLYVTDNNDQLPTSASAGGAGSNLEIDRPYFSKIAAYLDEDSQKFRTDDMGLVGYRLLRCPTQDKWSSQPDFVFPNGRVVGWSGIYAYNRFFSEYDKTNPDLRPLTWRRITDILEPADFPLLGESHVQDPLGSDYDAVSGVIMFGNNPFPTAYEFGWMGGDSRTKRHSYRGPAPNHNGEGNFLMADGHVEARNMCKAGAWPWLGDTFQQQQSQNAFHPKRNTKVRP